MSMMIGRQRMQLGSPSVPMAFSCPVMGGVLRVSVMKLTMLVLQSLRRFHLDRRPLICAQVLVLRFVSLQPFVEFGKSELLSLLMIASCRFVLTGYVLRLQLSVLAHFGLFCTCYSGCCGGCHRWCIEREHFCCRCVG